MALIHQSKGFFTRRLAPSLSQLPSARFQSSSSSSPSSPSPDSVDPADQPENTLPAEPSPLLTWDEYFRLKRRRVIIQRAVGAPTAVASFVGSMLFASTLNIEPTPIWGMDPMFLVALGSMSAGAAGYFSGTVGTGIAWRISNREKIALADQMDKLFFEKIAELRAQPNPLVLNTPPPDYYGEKIKSLSEYYEWIRKQREYETKHVAGQQHPVRK